MEAYPPLDEYGVIGDMRSAALVHRDGSVDWLCLPRFDSPWVLGRLIDWRRGGFLRVAPDGGCTVSRRYRTDSNVLETMWSADRDQAQVYDLMPVGEKHRLDAAESLRLLRIIEPVRGALQWQIDVCLAADQKDGVPEWRVIRAGIAQARGNGSVITLEFPAHFEVTAPSSGLKLHGELSVGTIGVVALHDGALGGKSKALNAERAIALRDRTDSFWRGWLEQCAYTGSYAPLVRRSALVLKMLQYAPTGAFVAAPTTSLPEADGGTLNWDYRYTWLRDMSVLVDTLHQLGFIEEVGQFMQWLDESCQCIPSDFQMLYRVDGDPDVTEHELTHLEGYRGSAPVRVGNAAADQKQLDVYGEIMEAAHAAWRRDRTMPRRRRAMLLQVVDHVLRHWDEADAGIWESRTRPKRYLYSQAMCWLALDRALRMDLALRLGSVRRAAARRARRELKRRVLACGFNKKAGAFTQAIDDEVLDASGLTISLTGMIDAGDPRVAATVDAIQRRLTRDGLVLRHIGEESEFGQGEGAFLVCTFWLIDVLAQMGRIQEAEELFARVSRCANDLGLFAEEYDADRETLVGNFPLALSHLSMLGAVLNIERAARAHSGKQP